MRIQFCGLGLDLAHKIVYHGDIPRMIENTILNRLSIAIVLPTLQLWMAMIGQVDVEIIGRTELLNFVKNKYETKTA